MTGNAETAFLGISGLIVSLVTAGLIPYMISKNTKQHKEGSEDRKSQKDQLDKLLQGQVDLKDDVSDVKGEVIGIKETRNADKEQFLKLYERVINADAERQRDHGVVDSDGSSSSASSHGDSVDVIPSIKLDQ